MARPAAVRLHYAPILLGIAFIATLFMVAESGYKRIHEAGLAISAAEDRVIALESADSTSDAEKQLLELRMELNAQMAIHTDEHPNVIAMQRRIERMEAEIGREENGGTERY